MSSINPLHLKTIEELKKYELEQKKHPAEAAREIYNNKGELGLIDTFSKVISYYIAGKLQKRYELGNFEWCLDFLEESFKILGAEEAAYLIKKDEEKWIVSWLGKYWPEIAKRNNLRKMDIQLVYGIRRETKKEKLDDDRD